MSKQHRFQPILDDKLEDRLVMSGGLVGNTAAVVEAAVRPGPRQVQRADRLIQFAYNRYLHELVDAANDGVVSIQTGTRTPELAVQGFKVFAARKEAFLERQLRYSVQGLPFARRVLLPQLNQIARSALHAVQETTNIDEVAAQATSAAVQPYATLSKQVVETGGRP